MQQLRRTFTFIVGALVLAALAPLSLRAQGSAQATPAIVGVWDGKAKGETGEMKIRVTVRSEKNTFSGSVTTPHGEWPIAKVTVKSDTWLIEFTRPDDGGTGKMTGKISGSAFTGDWDNSPMAVGTFEITRKVG